jgi:hypothetical protein
MRVVQGKQILKAGRACSTNLRAAAFGSYAPTTQDNCLFLESGETHIGLRSLAAQSTTGVNPV